DLKLLFLVEVGYDFIGRVTCLPRCLCKCTNLSPHRPCHRAGRRAPRACCSARSATASHLALCQSCCRVAQGNAPTWCCVAWQVAWCG
ncbi:hypothetical protein HAX54_027618, partial [Datura stramonium]|nr:hypothetical protein [Datura stramonium]